MLTATFQWVYDMIFAPIGAMLTATFQWVYDVIFAPIILMFTTTFQWIYNTLLMPFLTVLGTTFQWVSDTLLVPFLSGVVSTFQWVGTIFAPIIDSFKSAFGWIRDVLSPIAQVFKDAFQWIYNAIFKPFIDVVNSVGGVINSAVSAVQSVTNPTGKGGVISTVGNAISSGAKSVKKFLGFADGGIVPALKYLPSFADGGVVSGSSFSSGDSQKNDRIMSMLSPGEFVIPKSMVSSMLNGGGSGQGGVVQNISVNISVAAGSSLSDGTLKREVVPKIVEELRKMSQNGAQVLSKRGVY
jgi:phage-related protein